VDLFYTFLYRYSANVWSVASAAVELGKAAAAAGAAQRGVTPRFQQQQKHKLNDLFFWLVD
jgi:hypothetical protein